MHSFLGLCIDMATMGLGIVVIGCCGGCERHFDFVMNHAG
jgi:hypothetical protein